MDKEKLRQRLKPAKQTLERLKKNTIDPYNHTPVRWDFLGVFASFLWGVVAKIPLPGRRLLSVRLSGVFVFVLRRV